MKGFTHFYLDHECVSNIFAISLYKLFEFIVIIFDYHLYLSTGPYPLGFEPKNTGEGTFIISSMTERSTLFDVQFLSQSQVI